MGNLHNTRELPSIINPKDHPHLHIMRLSPTSPYTYVASVGTPWTLRLHYGKLEAGRFSSIEEFNQFNYPMVPELTIVPPPEINPLQVLQEMDSKLVQIAEALELNRTANMILSSHGSFWGQFPERRLRTVLGGHGFTAEEAFPLIVGIGRKRIQTHAVLINR
jgi:hypothetical protein